MSQLEPDPQFVQGLRLLHSSNKDSADQLRTLLDEAIKQKYGLAKMLCNVLHKKYTIEEPVLSDHSSSSSKKSKSSSSSSKHSNKSSKSGSPEDTAARDTPPDILQSANNLALELLEDDLTCIICKGMDVGARNRLVECVDCHALYHQECHVPPIQDSQIDVPRLIWYCSNCLKSQQPTKERGSPKTVTEGKTKETKKSSSGSKHTEKYKTGQSQSQSLTGSGASAASNNLPKPNIHIIAGDRRVKDSTKKSKQEKRGSGNGAGSGKHSASGSSSSGKSSQDKSSHKTKASAD